MTTCAFHYSPGLCSLNAIQLISFPIIQHSLCKEILSLTFHNKYFWVIKIALKEHFWVIIKVYPSCLLSFLRHCQTIFQVGCIDQWSSFSASLPAFDLVTSFNLAMIDVQWFCTVILICISMMAKDTNMFSHAYWPLYILFNEILPVFSSFSN